MSTEPAQRFRSEIGLFDATMLVAGAMIGSGIFIVSADIARDVGSSGWMLLVWIVTGVMTVVGGLCYAELAAMFPRAGGQYVFLRDAYGPVWGFLYGWTAFLVIQTGTIAAVAVAFAKFLGVLAPGLGPLNILYRVTDLHWEIRFSVPWLAEPLTFFKRDEFTISAGQVTAVGVIIFLTAVNALGVREGKWVQNIFTVTKIFALALLILLGFTAASDPAAWHRNFLDPWGGLEETPRFLEAQGILGSTWIAGLFVCAAAMVGSLFSSDAWHNVTFVAGETKNPERNLPLSLILGTGGVTLLYILANIAYLNSLPIRAVGDFQRQEQVVEVGLLVAENFKNQSEIDRLKSELVTLRGIQHAKDDRVGIAVVERVSPRFGMPIMALAIMVSTFGCVNGLILMGARLYYAMANDGLFFTQVGRLNAQGVPEAGLIFQAGWACLLVFSGSYGELLDYVIFAALLFYGLSIAALFVFRVKLPDRPRPYRALGYPVLPLLYLVLCGTIMLALLVVRPIYSWPSFIIVLTGVPVYFLWRGRNKHPVGSSA